MVGATDLEKARMQIKRLQAEVEQLRHEKEILELAITKFLVKETVDQIADNLFKHGTITGPKETK
jgi:prefoldin subunit 5